MIKTYVNEEKRTVVAVAEDCMFDAINQIIKRYPYIDENIIDAEYGLDFGLYHALMDDKYTAIAKCHPEDKFDPAEGRRIAKARLVEKLEAAMHKAVKRWIKHQETLMKQI